MSKKITNRKDWKIYWNNYKPVPFERLFFEEFDYKIPKKGSLIEIGGFPGKFAGYFKKKYNLDVTILDYVIFPKVVCEVEKLYKLENNSINIIETDFFNYCSDKKFDVVTSFGFIEHFQDTKDVIDRHLELLKKNGVFLATIPNFRGINGYIQKKLHPQNYNLHNIKSMDITLLKDILTNSDLSETFVDFVDVPSIWIEKDAPISDITRKTLYLFSKILQKIPFRKNYILAPHIIIGGVKK